MSDGKIAKDMAAALREVLFNYDHGHEMEEREAIQVAKALGAYDRAEKEKAAKQAAKAARPKPRERIAQTLAEMFGGGEAIQVTPLPDGFANPPGDADERLLIGV